ncbi:hypothetical protein GCM10017673_12950 [Streptosporangium violaceochromogenes]|nr:hypothetical protein GCM10017673_12950 [Streptosporangium violaceochromogenes]
MSMEIAPENTSLSPQKKAKQAQDAFDLNAERINNPPKGLRSTLLHMPTVRNRSTSTDTRKKPLFAGPRHDTVSRTRPCTCLRACRAGQSIGKGGHIVMSLIPCAGTEQNRRGSRGEEEVAVRPKDSARLSPRKHR